jgi:hypothetical protein
MIAANNSSLKYVNRKMMMMMMMMMIIQFFITYVPSQQLQGQLQTQRSVGTHNYIKDKHNIQVKDKLQTSTGGRTQ